MVIVRPAGLAVHCAASGQARQATANLAVLAGCLRPLMRMGTVTPAGQVTVAASRSMSKRSLGKWPLTPGGGWHLMPQKMPASPSSPISSPEP
jgi:hypothetical protein